MSAAFVDTVKAGLAALRARDPDGARVFGASVHRYRLNAKVPAAAVARFEKAHKIRLPDDYRAFLVELGNGGAGPHYGVFKLGEMDAGFGFQKWKAGQFVGRPAKPFPHTKKWNLPAAQLRRIQDAPDDEELLRVYWVSVDGAIPICHEGCALRDWLVVAGPQAGRVWHDATADYQGWWPVSGEGGRAQSFSEWYLAWLDEALRQTARGQSAKTRAAKTSAAKSSTAKPKAAKSKTKTAKPTAAKPKRAKPKRAKGKTATRRAR